MQHLGFSSCKADSDIWMRPSKKDDGSEYWEYILLYMDDALVISDRGEDIIRKELGRCFYIKEESIGPPTLYLGNEDSKVELENGVNAWSFSSSQYVKSAILNVENRLKDKGLYLPKKCTSPIKRDYRSEVDISSELDAQEAAYYQSLIGILRWIVELGRVDITTEVSMMASCMASPRKGHLDQVYHIFGYLKAHHNIEMVFDPSEPCIDEGQFEREDWSYSVYGSKEEELPTNAPTPLGYGFKIKAFVDSDHAGHTITRRSRSGYILYF